MQKSDFSLKKLRINEAGCEETTMFTAELFYGNKLVAYVKNDGRGGSHDYHAYETRQLLKESEEWAEKQPEKVYGKGEDQFSFKYSLDSLVDELIEAEDAKKFIKKIDKLAEKAIVFGNADYSGPITSVKFRLPIAEMLMTPERKAIVYNEYLKIKRELKKGQVILNKNLGFDVKNINQLIAEHVKVK